MGVRTRPVLRLSAAGANVTTREDASAAAEHSTGDEGCEESGVSCTGAARVVLTNASTGGGGCAVRGALACALAAADASTSGGGCAVRGALACALAAADAGCCVVRGALACAPDEEP